MVQAEEVKIEKKIALLILFFGTFGNYCLFSQEGVNTKISGNFNEVRVINILQAIENENDIKFYFDPGKLPYYPLVREFEEEPVFKVLENILSGTNLSFTSYDQKTLIIAERNNFNKDYAEYLINAWKTGQMSYPLSNEAREIVQVFGIPKSAGPFMLRGQIKDQYTREAVIGVVIQKNSDMTGTVTDVDGNFEMPLDSGYHELKISYVGYQEIRLKLNIYEDGLLPLEMNVKPLSLAEVVVSAKAEDDRVQSAKAGLEVLSIEKIREIPSLLGEPDLIKNLETLPGVSTPSEGGSGLIVRGGNIDQNLMLLGNTPIYNSSHALGLFSVFNSDLIQSVDLYKGGIPANYGGKISSVVNVNIKEGNPKGWEGRGGIGIISNRIAVEGPIIPGKTTAVIGARGTSMDWILKRFNQDVLSQSRAGFWDALVKINHRIPDGKISLQAYRSFDVISVQGITGYSWENQGYELDFKKIINPTLSFGINANVTKYNSELFDENGFDAFNLANGIQGANFIADMVWVPNEKHEINYGLEANFFETLKETLRPYSEKSSIASREIPGTQGRTFSAFVNDEISFSDQFKVGIGFRETMFQILGPADVLSYADGPRLPENVVDTTNYNSGEVIGQNFQFEPRVSISYFSADKKWSAKFAYNRINQYLHLFSNTISSSPVDNWRIANSFFPPQQGDGFSLGWYRNLKEKKYKLSIESYYKATRNVPAYKPFAQLLANEAIETEILTGNSESYGLEFGFNQVEGKWRWDFSYTLSRTTIQVPTNEFGESINGGNPYLSNFDTPHQLSWSLVNYINPTNQIGLTFTYKSGRPISLPIGKYFQDGTGVFLFQLRNADRIPPYIRMDLAYTLNRKEVRSKGLRSSFTFAVYNVIGRKNPFSVYFKTDEDGLVRPFKLSVIGTAIPSLVWNFQF